jgi:hypothetical protein
MQENWDRQELNGTHLLLIHADINLLGENTVIFSSIKHTKYIFLFKVTNNKHMKLGYWLSFYLFQCLNYV